MKLPWPGALAKSAHRVLLVAGLTGLVTGVAVAGFEWVAQRGLFHHLRQQPEGVQIFAPLVGLIAAALILRHFAGGASPATSDEYIKNFHEPGRRLDPRPVAGRLLASIATLGLGGSLGYEGPSIYLGASIGSWLQSKGSRWFSRQDAKVLLVAGAAGGVAAIFRAPATGLVFALEVPYQDDLARRMLLPAGVSSAVSYLVFAAFFGTAPLFTTTGTPPFDWRDLGGALVLGVLCGVGARLFTIGIIKAKHVTARINPFVRATLAGAGLAGLAATSYALFGRGLTLGAGYDNLTWAFDPRRAVGLVVALLILRALATILTVSGGGAGGLFIPLVVEGALVGRAVGGIFRNAATGSNFFPLVGVAAFLGAGYRVPLTGVVFAAEATGRPGFIVPGLIASIVAQLFMGRASASEYQVATHAGHLERRFSLPVSTALQANVPTVAPDTTLAEFFQRHLVGNRERAVAVVDGSRYLGLMRIEELHETPQRQWGTVTVAELMRTDFPTASMGWHLRDALTTMEQHDVDVLPVVDGDSFVGVVTTAEILKLDDILGMSEDS